nr:MAG: capsid protein [Chemarfal virus 102]
MAFRKYKKRSNPMNRKINRARYGRRKPMIRKTLKQPVQYFKRSAWLPNWLTTAAGADSFASINFRINQLPQFTEFTQLYDQYKINGVKLEIIPQYDSANVGAIGTNQISQNYLINDYDDVLVPTTMDTLMQNQTVKRCPSTAVMKHYIKPCIAMQVFNTGITSTYAARRGFVDCNSADTEHYGVKLGFTSNPLAQRYGLRMTFYLAFKNVR